MRWGRKIMAIGQTFWYNTGMFETRNEDELIALGQDFGEHLTAGQIIVLTGDLGAGKTTLTKGLAKGLGVSQMVKSPTYTIVREYEGRLPLYHLDVYRLGDDPDSIDLDDLLYGDGVVVIEWGKLLSDELLDDYLEIVITPQGDGRRLDLLAQGPRSANLLEVLTNG